MTTAHVFVSGFVQGVGYRQFIKKHAMEIGGISGWVCNLPDKRVEMVLQGEKRALEGMLLFCRKGPFLSEVDDVRVTWEKTDKVFSGFEVVQEPLI